MRNNKKPYHEVDSFQDLQGFDEARYYEGDQFELGGVDFGLEPQDKKSRENKSREKMNKYDYWDEGDGINTSTRRASPHRHGWDRPGRHSGDYGVPKNRRSRYQQREPYFESSPSHTGKGPKNYQRSDERLQEEISEALYRSHDVDAREIIVEVKDGHVHLRGQVESRQTKKLAERCIENVPGIRDIFNELTLIPENQPAELKTTQPNDRPDILEDLDRFRMA